MTLKSIPIQLHHHQLFRDNCWMPRPDIIDDMVAGWELLGKHADAWELAEELGCTESGQRSRIETVACMPSEGVSQFFGLGTSPHEGLAQQSVVDVPAYFRIWVTKPYPVNLTEFLGWELHQNKRKMKYERSGIVYWNELRECIAGELKDARKEFRSYENHVRAYSQSAAGTNATVERVKKILVERLDGMHERFCKLYRRFAAGHWVELLQIIEKASNRECGKSILFFDAGDAWSKFWTSISHVPAEATNELSGNRGWSVLYQRFAAELERANRTQDGNSWESLEWALKNVYFSIELALGAKLADCDAVKPEVDLRSDMPPLPLYLRSDVPLLISSEGNDQDGPAISEVLDLSDKYLFETDSRDRIGHTKRVTAVQFPPKPGKLFRDISEVPLSAHWQGARRREKIAGQVYDRHVMRGGDVVSQEEASRYATNLLVRGNCLRPHYFWGGVPVAPLSTSNPHRLVIGGSGTGKTLMFRTLMKYLLPMPSGRFPELAVNRIARVPPDYDLINDSPEILSDDIAAWTRSTTTKAIVYDSKTENASVLIEAGFNENTDLIILSPLDIRCWGWDLAKDVVTDEEIEQLAAALVPDGSSFKGPGGDDKDAFFLNNSRALIVAIVQSLINAAQKKGIDPSWTLFDIIKAYSSHDTLRWLINEYHPFPSAVNNQIFDNRDQRTYGNIYASLATRMRSLALTASRWHHAQHKCNRAVSLREFVSEGSGKVLLLPETNKNEPVLRPLNELMVRRLSQLLTDNHVNPHTHERPATTQFFVDELQSAGRFEDLIHLATRGRSFGVELTLGVQSKPLLDEMYGRELGSALLEMCLFRAYFRAQDETAKWAEEAIGRRLLSIKKTSYTSGTTTTLGKTTGNTRTKTSGINESTTDSSGRSNTFSQGSNRTRTGPAGPYRPHRKGDPPLPSPTEAEGTNTSYSSGENYSRSTTQSINESTSTAYAESTTDSSAESASETQSTEERFESKVLASEIAGLPDVEASQIVSGYMAAPHLPIWESKIPLVQMLEHGINPTRPETNFVPFPREFNPQNTEWDESDRKRLALHSKARIRIPKHPAE